MEYEQIILLQKKFARFHRLVLYLFVLFEGIRFLAKANTLFLYQPLCFLLVLLGENAVFKLEPVKVRWLCIIKYFYIAMAVVLISTTGNLFMFGSAIICLALFEAELFLLIDFTDSYVQKMFLAGMCIPALSVLVLRFQFKKPSDIKIFTLIIIMAFVIGFVKKITDVYAYIVSENAEKVFAQTRLIERINDTNEELRIHQEKVKTTNELLGVQKIELQSAYIKINNVNAEMRVQNEIIKYISASLDINKLMDFITEAFVKRIGMDVCVMILEEGAVHNRNKIYKINSVLTDANELFLKQAVQENDFEYPVQEMGYYCDNNVTEGKYPFLSKTVVKSILLVPLIKQEKRIGSVLIGNNKRDYFIDNIDFFEGIVSQFMIGINNANLYQEMQYMAVLDGLTGIYNRRYLAKLFNQYMYECINKGTPLSAALFDIDFFKKINDTYGHLFGDEVIKTIASLAKKVADEYGGVAARYGGEEFVIIFPNKGIKEAYPAVEKLHSDVKKQDIMHHGKKVIVNVSVGFTSFPSTCKDPRELLNRADWSMYYSKQHGRDRITIDSDEIQKEVALK